MVNHNQHKGATDKFLDLYDKLVKVEEELEDTAMALEPEVCMKSKKFRFIRLISGDDKPYKQLEREINESLFHLSAERKHITDEMGEISEEYYRTRFGF